MSLPWQHRDREDSIIMQARKRIAPPGEVQTALTDRRSKRRRSALSDLENDEEDCEEIEARIPEAQEEWSDGTLEQVRFRWRYFLSYLVARDIKSGKIDKPRSESEFTELTEEREKLLRFVEYPELQDFRFWSLLLHIYGINSSGKLSSGELPSAHRSTTQLGSSMQDSDLTEEEKTAACALPFPSKDATPCTYAVIVSASRLMTIGFKLHAKINLPKDGVIGKALRLLKTVNLKLNWYPTTVTEKEFCTKAVARLLLRAFWRPAIMPVIMAQVVSLHLAFLCLWFYGFRVLSWVDNYNRKKNVKGTYLRWSQVQFKFLGYEDDQAQFIVFGSVHPTKFGKKLGAQASHPFSIGTRQDDIVFDIATAFVVLGVISKVMPEMLREVIENPETGKKLLKGRKEYTFSCLPEHRNRPVFVAIASSHDFGKEYKQALDAPSPSLDKNLRPMSELTFRQHCTTFSNLIGLARPVTSSVLRRTWSLNAQLVGKLKPHEIAERMQHYSGNQLIHQRVYIPTYKPTDDAEGITGEASSSKLVQEAFKTHGSSSFLPSLNDFDEEEVESLRNAVGQLLAAMSTDEDADEEFDPVAEGHSVNDREEQFTGTSKPVVSEGEISANTAKQQSIRDATEELLSVWNQMTGFNVVNGLDVLRAASRLLEISDYQKRNSKLDFVNHPWEDPCNSELTKIIKYTANPTTKVCHCCLGEEHKNSSSTRRTEGALSVQATLNNECYVKVQGKSHCFICWTLVKVDKIEKHVEACFQALFRAIPKDVTLTVKDHAFVQGLNRGPRIWEQAGWHVCLFECCINPKMRRSVFDSTNEHFKPLALTKPARKEGYAIVGNKLLPTFEKLDKYKGHNGAHVFCQVDGRCDPIIAIKAKRCICPIFNCEWKSDRLEIGKRTGCVIAYLCHLVNEHQLPILFTSAGLLLKSVEASQFRGKLPMYRDKPSKPSSNSQTDANGVFCYRQSIVDYKNETGKHRRKLPDTAKYLSDDSSDDDSDVECVSMTHASDDMRLHGDEVNSSKQSGIASASTTTSSKTLLQSKSFSNLKQSKLSFQSAKQTSTTSTSLNQTKAKAHTRAIRNVIFSSDISDDDIKKRKPSRILPSSQDALIQPLSDISIN